MIFEWTAGSIALRWAVSDPIWTEWTVGFADLEISHLSTEYVLVPIAATTAGSTYNPTSDTVQFAFMPTPTQVPGVSDWVSGSWETVPTSIIYPYNARVLVGPTGATALTSGSYTMYMKITDNPEVPVLVVGTLGIM